MEEGIVLAQFIGAGFGAEVAVGAVGAFAFEAGAEIEGANLIAAPTVGAGFIRVGKLHNTSLIGLQEHLDQRVGASFLAEVLLIVNEERHETCH